MTTPQDINAALDAFKMINRGPAESPNENEIMFNGFLLEKEVRIIEQILQSRAQETEKKDDPLSMGFISVDRDGTKRLDVAGYLSTPEGHKRLAEIMGKGSD